MPKKINLQNLKLGYTDGTKVSEEDTKAFLIKLNEMSKKYEGTTPEDFLTLFIKENGLKDGVLLLDQKSKATTNDKGGRARGLIQFVPSTAEGLGLDQELTATMKPVEQLDFVDKYYEPYKDSIKDYESLYLSTFYPAALGQSDDFVIGEGEQKAYTSNKGIDVNKDKKITVSDFKKYAANTKPAQPKNLFEEVSDIEYTNSYANLIAPPEPEFDVRSSTNDKKWVAYLRTTDDQGNESERLLGTYNKSQYPSKESINLVNIGENQYVVASERKAVNIAKKGERKPVEETRISNSYKKIKIDKDGSIQTTNVKDKTRLYTDEIENIIKKEGVTRESVEKARQIFEQSENDLYQEDKDHDVIGEVYENKARIPFIEQNIESARVFAESKLNQLNSQILTAKPEDQKKLREQVKAAEAKLFSIENAQNSFAEKVREIRKNVPAGGYAGRGTHVGAADDYRSNEQRERFQDFLNLEKEFNKIKELDSFKDYNESLIKEEQKKQRDASANKSDSKKTYTPQADTDTRPDPNDMDSEEEEVSLGQGEYLDRQALEDTLADITEQLENAETVEEFTPDLSMLDNQNADRYSNLISMAGDLGAGIMGLKGAMEEVPIYEKGEMFNAYTDEAYRQRNMGLTAEEMGLRKQLAERGFGYDVKNIRRLAGGSAGVALGNLGRAAGTLQTRYGQIAAEDSAVRRMNQQRFDRAALSDETFNRRKFEDSFKVAMLNKEMGAQLVRDKMKNMHERQMFEKQYGKGSVYDALSREMLASKQANTHALKMAEEYQVQKQKDYLTKRQRQIESDLRKAKEQEKKASNQ